MRRQSRQSRRYRCRHPASPQRKQSRWKGVFSLQKQSAPEVPAILDLNEEFDSPKQMSATVNNVSNIIMGLSPPPDDRGRRRDRSGERARDNNHLGPQSPDWQRGVRVDLASAQYIAAQHQVATWTASVRTKL